ncbi:MAG: alpha/beta fold hydrolase [Planctomycetota bacterium]|nr:alpha/beta fold hydrolase [Planctomycetota bacterium]
MCVLMWLAQGLLLFHPSEIGLEQWNSRLAHAGAAPIELVRGGATVRGFVRPGGAGSPAPTVLYFGGNGERVWGRVQQWVPPGWGFAAMSYRGYGPSSGEPSADAILDDSVAFFDALAQRPEVDGARIVTWGLSLGTGVAVHVASRRPVAGVVLLAPFDRLSSVGQDHYPWLPVSLVFRHEIAPVVEAPSIGAPLLAFHGDADTVIPIERGRALRDAWKGPVTWRELEGSGHTDLERTVFRGTFLSFLQELER